MIACRPKAATIAIVIIVLIVVVSGNPAQAQALMVLPVNIQMDSGQRTTTLTVVNQGTSETAVQIRVYAWNQQDGDDHLTASNAVLASPPLISIAPGAPQVIRLVLRESPQSQEATYRILLDQIPPPAVPGAVRIVLRLSIPVFVQAATHALPHVMFHVERKAGEVYLVAVNNGARHEAIRNIVLETSDGRKLSAASSASPYILAGATRRWPIPAPGPLLLLSETLRLTAHADTGAVQQQVSVIGIP